MSNMNKVILMGNITRDPELKELPSGSKLCDFGLAVNRTYTTQSGEQRDETTFVDLSCFARGGEVIHQYCRKGSPLFVEGRLRYDSWTNEQGEKRNKLKVIVETFQLLPDGKQGGGYSAPTNNPDSARGAGTSGGSRLPDNGPFGDEDPF
jgi:single-strand DNA-binding protein